ncbi:F10K1.23 [Salix purpurea]|uniref:F10K1.23 n=1 Tax=Salix purpurea TaxID=77065 RepID=A0A9Q0VUR3_SALPP|nr:F10K1.23 [Salix purpurea]
MAGDTETPHQITLFRSQITTRRFNDESLRILESLLVFKDVKSQAETRSDLKQFLRFESLSVFQEIKYKTVYQKLSLLQFFVRAFALIGDTESCLALKYEALLFRDVKSTSDQSLHVSYLEWLDFAQHLLDQGFYSIATQACEKALACFQKKDVADAKTGDFIENARVIEYIKRFKDRAMKSAASGSGVFRTPLYIAFLGSDKFKYCYILVCGLSSFSERRAQAAEYLKRRIVEKSRICSSFRTETKSAASTLFRNGIKKRHARELRKHQSLQQSIEF